MFDHAENSARFQSSHDLARHCGALIEREVVIDADRGLQVEFGVSVGETIRGELGSNLQAATTFQHSLRDIAAGHMSKAGLAESQKLALAAPDIEPTVAGGRNPAFPEEVLKEGPLALVQKLKAHGVAQRVLGQF